MTDSRVNLLDIWRESANLFYREAIMHNPDYWKKFPRSPGIWGCLVFLLLLWADNSPSSAAAAQLTFDELTPPTGGLVVPNGYGGFQWNNFYALNAAATSPSGYAAGMLSQPNVGYNGFGDPAQLSNVGPFDLNSGYFTAAWHDGLQLEVRGYIGLTLAYDNTYTLSATTPSLLNFDYVGVTSVDFISSGGTHHPGYGPDGTQFVMDNLTVTIVPEPAAITLFGVGVILLAAKKRRDRRAATEMREALGVRRSASLCLRSTHKS